MPEPLDLANLASEDWSALDQSGAEILAQVENFLRRFVAYPSEHALVAHVLWIAHAHLMDSWESTPRISFQSAERGSGKRDYSGGASAQSGPTVQVLVDRFTERAPTMVHNKIEAVQRTPGDKCPACSMPQSSQYHGYHEVNVTLRLSSAVSSKRYVEIIP